MLTRGESVTEAKFAPMPPSPAPEPRPRAPPPRLPASVGVIAACGTPPQRRNCHHPAVGLAWLKSSASSRSVSLRFFSFSWSLM